MARVLKGLGYEYFTNKLVVIVLGINLTLNGLDIGLAVALTLRLLHTLTLSKFLFFKKNVY